MVDVLLAAVCGAVVGVGTPRADGCIRLIGVVRVDPLAEDTSGLHGPCGLVPHNRLGGWGSAIEWTGRGIGTWCCRAA
ncbi:MAG TPA: hypothetical protein VEB22_13385, partial [Phycisphaerales bacterium]|nr:hypothetical protein [Phycisphaerales bacterium]